MSYRIIRENASFIDEYFKDVPESDLKFFDINYHKKMVKNKSHFLYKLERVEKEDNKEEVDEEKTKIVGLFGMYKLDKFYTKTFLLHLKKSERGLGIGYFLQYLRLFLAKQVFPTVRYVTTNCNKKAERAIKLYDAIYKINHRNRQLKYSFKQNWGRDYIKYKANLNFLLKEENEFTKFIKKDDYRLIEDITSEKNKFYDLSVFNKKKS